MRRAVRDRAAVHRHRRRLLLPLRAGRRRQGRCAERLRPRAGRRHDRLVRAARHHRAGEHLGPRRHRARRDQCLGDAAEGAWPQGAGRAAAAGDPLRRRRLAGAPEGRLGLEAAGGEAAQERRARASCPAVTRRTPATSSGIRRWPRRCAPSPGMAPRRSTKAPIAADMVATLRERGGLHTEEDFAAGLAQRRIRRADHAELARLRRVSVPAQRPGHHRADDPRHARRHRRRHRTARSARCAIIATSRPRAWPIATATRSSPIRRRSMCR